MVYGTVLCGERDSVLIHLPLLAALMGYSKIPYSERFDGGTEIKLWICGNVIGFKRLKRGNERSTEGRTPEPSLNTSELSDSRSSAETGRIVLREQWFCQRLCGRCFITGKYYLLFHEVTVKNTPVYRVKWVRSLERVNIELGKGQV